MMCWVDGKLKRIPYRMPSGPGEEHFVVLARVALTRPGVMVEELKGTVNEVGSTHGIQPSWSLSMVWGVE